MGDKSLRTSRWFRIPRWGGLVVCAALLVVWTASLGWELQYVRSGTRWSFALDVANGQIGVYSLDRPFLTAPPDRWSIGRIPFRPDWTWDVNLVTGKIWIIILPFWMLLAIASAAAALPWIPLHRRRPGHCPRCDYDLTGNTSGVCPECGRTRDR